MRLDGIAASPGIAIGPVLRIEPEVLSVRETEVAPAEQETELESFRLALEDSRGELASIPDSIAVELGEQEAAI